MTDLRFLIEIRSWDAQTDEAHITSKVLEKPVPDYKQSRRSGDGAGPIKARGVGLCRKTKRARQPRPIHYCFIRPIALIKYLRAGPATPIKAVHLSCVAKLTMKLCSFSASSWDAKFTDQSGTDSDFRATLLFCERRPAWRGQPRGQSEDHREAN